MNGPPQTAEVPIQARRLFLGSCIALIATSVAFATVGAVMLTLKREFILTNEQVGWIGGAALWGFAVSQLVFAPLCDTLGMRMLLRLAFVGHVVGSVTMIFAGGFGMLFTGALIIAMGNGLVEAACNPLVAALYPDNKTVKLNQFHVWFPGGIVLGGLAAFSLDQVGMSSWQLKLGLILIPTAVYGILLLPQRFPPTEGVKSGISMSAMFRSTFRSPLMYLMLFAMALTASVELGPNRWVPAVLEAGGMQGILVLVWINGLMAFMRFRAGPIVHRLSPTGILVLSAGVAGIGLFWLSYAESGVMAFASATIFALGVCYFWPTMLGFVSERIPRSGALGLGLMGTVGMAFVGLVTSPVMGGIADEYAHEQLPSEETVLVLRNATTDLADIVPNAADAETASHAAQGVLDALAVEGSLPPIETANALRAIIATGAQGDVIARAQMLLGPADNYGGRISFRYVVPMCGVLLILFAALYMRDRRAGGYRAQSLTESKASA